VLSNKDIPTLDGCVHAERSGCGTTRKSTAGKVIRFLGATIHFGFGTQSVVAFKLQLPMNTDSTGGKHIMKRMGSSKKAKHIDLKYLFLQQLVHNGIQSVHKISTLDNPSDIFTEYVTA